ncbi:hypothetical protein Tco_1469883, partial [Tanacetum coccineum]
FGSFGGGSFGSVSFGSSAESKNVVQLRILWRLLQLLRPLAENGLDMRAAPDVCSRGLLWKSASTWCDLLGISLGLIVVGCYYLLLISRRRYTSSAMKKLIAKLPTLTAPKKEEELMVYLSAADEAVSVVLLVERDERQTPIHYTVKKILSRSYNQGYHRQANKLNIEQSGGNGKIGQVGNTMTEDNPTQVKTDGSNDTLAEVESMEEQEDTKSKTPKNLRA